MKRLILSAFVLVLAAVPGRLMMAAAQEQTDSSLTVHVLQRGENVSDVALKYGLSTEQVIQANGITDVSSITVGQRLIVPLAKQPPQQDLMHTVVTGNTLSSIAAAYGKTLEELRTLNNLANAHQIFIGQKLLIEPAQPRNTANSADAPPTPPAARTDAFFGDPNAVFSHQIQAGETMFEIGLRYNLTVTTLAQANNIANPAIISIGQQLVIPGIELPRLVGTMPAAVSEFIINPPVLVEGQTGRIEIQTTEPVEISGRFLGQDLVPIPQDNGTQHNILIGIPMFTEQGVYPLQLNLVDARGVASPINLHLQIIGGGYGRQNITINNDDLLAESIENEEIDLLARTTSQFNPDQSWTNSLSLPAAAAMNGLFGTRRSYNGGAFDRFHRGVDFAGATGTSVLAAADGTVVIADALKIRGNTAVIDHGWGVYTVYAHQNALYVNPGDAVTSGQAIGTIGSTGRSTGPHLHWEVWVNGVTVDPMQWVQETFP